MKNAIFNSRSMVTLLTIITIGYTQTTFATEVKVEASEKKSEITYAGNMENHPVFQLKLNNAEYDEYLVTITDQNFGVLYSGRLRGKNVSQKYRLDVEREDLQNVEIHITSKKTQQSNTYKIKQSIAVTEAIWVAKF